jgi:hypothetical protein
MGFGRKVTRVFTGNIPLPVPFCQDGNWAWLQRLECQRRECTAFWSMTALAGARRCWQRAMGDASQRAPLLHYAQCRLFDWLYSLGRQAKP